MGRRRTEAAEIARQFAEGALSAGHEAGTESLFSETNLHGFLDGQTCRRSGGPCIGTDDVPEMGCIEELELPAADVLAFVPAVYFSASHPSLIPAQAVYGQDLCCGGENKKFLLHCNV
ncbi:MAG: hypothetical protein K5841_02025 [Fretibacterium sp.]|nr:hypothetical protein [Fretibacterium sp.]